MCCEMGGSFKACNTGPAFSSMHHWSATAAACNKQRRFPRPRKSAAHYCAEVEGTTDYRQH